MSAHKDTILINNLTIHSKIGCSIEERDFPQRLEFDLAIELDLKPSALSRKVEDTVCYHTVKDQLIEFVGKGEWILVEELAEEICKFLMEEHPLIEGIKMQIRKFVVPNTDWVGVKIYRERVAH
ncbi:hypothetical protein BVY02_00770 [bacterium J17]|nr:hypothetical protein BVY02_00770 [bacterium J17]